MEEVRLFGFPAAHRWFGRREARYGRSTGDVGRRQVGHLATAESVARAARAAADWRRGLRDLTNDAITHLAAEFLPDGRRFIFMGFDPGKRPRAWIQDLSGAAPRAITPEGITGALVSPNGKMVMARDEQGGRKLYRSTAAVRRNRYRGSTR